jgi:trehalose/maltose hydrolase-like predicted phosphorylase
MRAATALESFDDLARLLVTAEIEPGKPLRLDKLLAYGWSARRSPPAIIDQVSAALAGARSAGWDGLLSGQRSYLEAFWDGADVEVGGDAELQQAVRFGMFHSLQAAARGERRAIAAKGLTGSGYDGHAFWDAEAFVLPLLTYVAPKAAGDALRWRHRTLPIARERAQALGLNGASFAWRTIHGEECSGYWPAGTDAFTLEEKRRDFAYYEELTVRDSSLSACTQAVLATETGHEELACDYLREAALIDLDDLQHNTRDGVHIASRAGAWIGVVAGLGGMRDHDRRLSFRPSLPDEITDVRFRLGYRGRRLLVEVTREHARYTLRDGEPLEIDHYEEALTLTAAAAQSRPIPPRAGGEPPRQPAGRAPLERRPQCQEL